MGSTRLPGKVLADIHGAPMISRQMARMKLSTRLDEIVVAIPESRTDDVLAAYCLSQGWAVYRGPEWDVLGRYLDAAEAAGADTVVRVTADCPCIDPFVIDCAFDLFTSGGAAGPFDFVSNNLAPTFPHGLDVEVMSRGTLAIAAAKATAGYDREHVTPWITRASAGGAVFRLGNLPSPVDLSMYRLTVDYPEDLIVARAIYERYPGHFSTPDVIAFLNVRPDLMALNARHRQQPTPLGYA
jgi:spore coat polysaccharide biosynthesis protein SpsF